VRFFLPGRVFNIQVVVAFYDGVYRNFPAYFTLLSFVPPFFFGSNSLHVWFGLLYAFIPSGSGVHKPDVFCGRVLSLTKYPFQKTKIGGTYIRLEDAVGQSYVGMEITFSQKFLSHPVLHAVAVIFHLAKLYQPCRSFQLKSSVSRTNHALLVLIFCGKLFSCFATMPPNVEWQ